MSAGIEQFLSQHAQSRRISPTIVRNLAQILDSTVIIAVGFAVISISVLFFTESGDFSTHCVAILVGAAIACVLFHAFGVYEQERLVSRTDVVQPLLAAWATTFAVLLAVAFVLKTTDQFSRLWGASWFVVSGGLLVAVRLGLREWIVRRAIEGVLAERSIIFGAGDCGQQFADQITTFEDPFLKVVGFIDDRATRVPRTSMGLQLLGDTTTMLNLIRANMVDHVYVALPMDAHHRVKQVIDQLAQTPVRVSLVSSPSGLDVPVQAMKYINKSLTIQVFDHALSGRWKLSKWFEDRLIAILLLVLVAPLMLAIAVAIRFESEGPVFVRHKRFGFNDKPIDVWKFRTTRVPDRRRREPLHRTAKGDSAVTAFGGFLRKSALDELPQLFNVLLGDMSIVGPRPTSASQAQKSLPFERIIERCAAWHQIKPGMTGWAQVNGCYGDANTAAKLKKELKHDLHYIENWSLILDVWIIMRTVALVFKDRTVQ